MKMHPVAGFTIQRFGHKGDRLAGQVSGHFAGVFDQHGGITGLYQTHHGGLNFRLPGSAHFMVMVLYRNAHLLQVESHLIAKVEKLVFGRDGVITAVHRVVMPMPAFPAVPLRFSAFDAVTGTIDRIFKRDIIKNIKLKLRPP